ncbi:hypothetical protein ACM26V_00460 [Salipaludibacillus sp. HK11]|uniref:hypothetical protein n=1 Tax=Salipaludibacillus sp. HK11 TaxID=3394320 RepID=UPI0039FBEF43
MKLPIVNITKLLIKASEKKLEEIVWERWLVDYQNMDDKTFVSFNNYLKKMKAPQEQSTPETVAETFNKLKSKVKNPE